MKKILTLLASISLGTVVTTNVVACLSYGGGKDTSGNKLDLSTFSYDKIVGTSPSSIALAKSSTIVKDSASGKDVFDLSSGITRAIQNKTSTFLDWSQVDIETSTSAALPEYNLSSGTLKMTAKSSAVSFKNSVMWGDPATSSFVDIRANLTTWLTAAEKVLTIANTDPQPEDTLDKLAFTALMGTALDTSITTLQGIGLSGNYDKTSSRYTVSLSGTSNYFSPNGGGIEFTVNKS